MSPDSKTKALELCQKWVAQRSLNVQEKITALQEVLSGSHKSTAGDKHNTERAMLQIEREQLGQQMANVKQDLAILSRINLSATSIKIHLGSLIITNSGIYFVSISAGALQIDKAQIMAISVASPIGRALLGKEAGDVVPWRAGSITILDVL